jgi:hypothetical protein
MTNPQRAAAPIPTPAMLQTLTKEVERLEDCVSDAAEALGPLLATLHELDDQLFPLYRSGHPELEGLVRTAVEAATEALAAVES